LLLPHKSPTTQCPITCRRYVTSPEADRAEGLCGAAARRSAAEPEALASSADAHTCCYGQLRRLGVFDPRRLGGIWLPIVPLVQRFWRML
jgi:hypothetical protein